jgi:hypothetical protein
MNTTQLNEPSVRSELISVGISHLWRLRGPVHHLAGMLNIDEHVRAAAAGKIDTARSIIIASDLRILIASHSPFISTCEEFSFDAVTGIKHIEYGLFSSIVLHTIVGDFRLNKVNNYSARVFAQKIDYKLAQHYNSKKMTKP